MPSAITGEAPKPQAFFALTVSSDGGSSYIQRMAPVARSSATSEPARDPGNAPAPAVPAMTRSSVTAVRCHDYPGTAVFQRNEPSARLIA